MLKLERNKNHEVRLQFRQRNSLFTRAFLAAFGIAVGLHALAGIVFRIHSFLNTEDTRYLPVVVEIEMNSMGEIVASLDDAEIFKEIFPPSLSSPHAPFHFSSLNYSSIQVSGKAPLPANAFIPLEENLEYLVKHVPKRTGPVLMHLSGRICELAVAQPLLDKSTQAKLNVLYENRSCHEAFLSYSVKVEGKSGVIFWQDCRSPTEDVELVHLAEHILKNIQFAPHQGIIDGIVELSFFSEESS